MHSFPTADQIPPPTQLVRRDHGHRSRIHLALRDPIHRPVAPYPLHHRLRLEHRPLDQLLRLILHPLRPLPGNLWRPTPEPSAASFLGHGPNWPKHNHKYDCAAVCPALGTGNGDLGVGFVVD